MTSDAETESPPAAAVLALVGRPNVGKSTLFNRLCGARAALVADHPGLTRDRHYGRAELAGRPATLIDTGGLMDAPPPAGIAEAVAAQVELALDEADLAVLIVDARQGLTAADQDIARRLRRRGAQVALVVNKIDAAASAAAYEFAALGFGEPLPVSAAHGRGVAAMAAALMARLPAVAAPPPAAVAGVRVAVVGRPNVGKSTLVNHLVGAPRQVAHAQPGTTRDAVEVPWGDHVLIDTAGVRRKGRTTGTVEKFSIVKTLAALDRAAVAVLVVDGHEGIVDQDLHILHYALEAGAGVLVAVNKWDAVDAPARRHAKASVDRRLVFAPWVPVRFVSALRGAGTGALLATVEVIHRSGEFDVKTADLNRILASAIRDHSPPVVRSRPVKLRYAHKIGAHPPRVVIHGNQTEALPVNYLRYLAGRFRAELKLVGVPLRIETRTSENPFAGRPNELNRRQLKRRQRLIRHRRGSRRRRGR